jgi:hypothetical protein
MAYDSNLSYFAYLKFYDLLSGAHGCAPSMSNLASLRGNERRGLGQSPILIKISDSATLSFTELTLSMGNQSR